MCFSKLFCDQPIVRSSLIFRLQQILRHLLFYTLFYILYALCILFTSLYYMRHVYAIYSISMYMSYSISYSIYCIWYSRSWSIKEKFFTIHLFITYYNLRIKSLASFNLHNDSKNLDVSAARFLFDQSSDSIISERNYHRLPTSRIAL